MLSQEEIAEQQKLLSTYRKTLAIYRQQQAAIGEVFTPPGLQHGIVEARYNIARIKAVLCAAGATVEDDSDDDKASTVFIPTVQPSKPADDQRHDPAASPLATTAVGSSVSAASASSIATAQHALSTSDVYHVPAQHHGAGTIGEGANPFWHKFIPQWCMVSIAAIILLFLLGQSLALVFWSGWAKDVQDLTGLMFAHIPAFPVIFGILISSIQWLILRRFGVKPEVWAISNLVIWGVLSLATQNIGVALLCNLLLGPILQFQAASKSG